MCHPSLRGKAGPSRLPGCGCNGFWTLRPTGYSEPVKKQIRTTREAPSGCGGLSGDGRLGGLLPGGGEARFGALDALLFGGATPPDVRLHRGYNPAGPHHLQCPRCQDQFAARWHQELNSRSIELGIVKMGWRT